MSSAVIGVSGPYFGSSYVTMSKNSIFSVLKILSVAKKRFILWLDLRYLSLVSLRDCPKLKSLSPELEVYVHLEPKQISWILYRFGGHS